MSLQWALFLRCFPGAKDLLYSSTMQEATVAPQMGGIAWLTGFILRITALFELAGAAGLLPPTFCADYGLRGIW